MGESIDEFCQIRSIITDIPNHGPSVMMMNTGDDAFGAAVDGLVGDLRTGNGEPESARASSCFARPAGDGGASRWGTSGSCRRSIRARSCRTSRAEPEKQIQYLTNPKFDLGEQRRQLDLLERLNRMDIEEQGKAPEFEAAIQSMEVAFRMQTEAPEVFDFEGERGDARRATAG